MVASSGVVGEEENTMCHCGLGNFDRSQLLTWDPFPGRYVQGGWVHAEVGSPFVEPGLSGESRNFGESFFVVDSDDIHRDRHVLVGVGGDRGIQGDLSAEVTRFPEWLGYGRTSHHADAI